MNDSIHACKDPTRHRVNNLPGILVLVACSPDHKTSASSGGGGAGVCSCRKLCREIMSPLTLTVT